LNTTALLILEDGSTFHGRSIGATGMSAGEVVFNTSITGYQEILTDPSYARQLVTLTYPHIGNVGTNQEDVESDSVFCSGLIVKNVPKQHSNWRAGKSLPNFLMERGVIAISDIDTRKLTRLLRTKGAQRGCIVAGEDIAGEDIDIAAALAAAKSFPGLAGMDLAKEVTTVKPYTWRDGVWNLETGYASTGNYKFRIVACGPGDPEPCDYAIATIQKVLEQEIPVFGICLGHQLLSLAAGARTEKMKFGHHGANHPVQDLQSMQVLITSQNHGFTVDENSLNEKIRVTHRSLFDGTVQGIELIGKPAFSFQGHPEASPGPRDITCLFDKFIQMMEASTRGKDRA
jgi:carbamoyl-phosphate synthase small subunit